MLATEQQAKITGATPTEHFAEHIRRGLSATPKTLSSQYFYDDAGSRLFQQIMELPEYYLTRCETEIFTKQAAEICAAFTAGDMPFDLIELGAGDGSKTALLIRHLLNERAEFAYLPVDISAEALNLLSANFHGQFPTLRIESQRGDYFRILETLTNRDANRKKVILFLGSNVGNFTRAQSLDFFTRLRATMNAGDLLFIGLDLQKDPHTILQAYDDEQGVTAAFNLNLLKRINRELDADFNLENFAHYATYHPTEGAAKSFILSRAEQTVTIGALGESFDFIPWEPIYVEMSQKYNLPLINALAAACDFRVRQNFFDSQNYYADSLWQPLVN